MRARRSQQLPLRIRFAGHFWEVPEFKLETNQGQFAVELVRVGERESREKIERRSWDFERVQPKL